MLGRLSEVAGWRERDVEGALSTGSLVLALSAADPVLGDALGAKGVQVAVNKTIVRGDHPLVPADEIAFLPPMSGG